MTLLLNGFVTEPGSDDLVRDFESGSGRVASARDFADAFDVRSVQSVPNFQGTEPVDTSRFEIAASQEVTPDPAQVQTQQDKGIGDFARDIFGNLFDTLKTTATAAAQGAVEGATAASQGAVTGSQIGARATTLGTTFSTTTLLIGALVLVLLLRR